MTTEAPGRAPHRFVASLPQGKFTRSVRTLKRSGDTTAAHRFKPQPALTVASHIAPGGIASPDFRRRGISLYLRWFALL